MQMKLIDILVKVANKESVPKKMKHKTFVYTFDEYKIDYKCDHKCNNKTVYLFENLMTYRDKCLDDYIEIIEE